MKAIADPRDGEVLGMIERPFAQMLRARGPAARRYHLVCTPTADRERDDDPRRGGAGAISLAV